MPASSWTLWNRLSMVGGPRREAGSCTTAIEAANTSPSDTLSAWRRPASSLRWVASAILTTMLSPKPSTASTRPRSSIGVDHGAHARPSSSPRSNGSTGSTIAGCWNPSATSRRPKLRSATTPGWMSHPWPRDSNETASDQPGAVHIGYHVRSHAGWGLIALHGSQPMYAIAVSCLSWFLDLVRDPKIWERADGVEGLH